MTSTPTRPVDNVVITTKGLQDRNINILDGTRVENKGKLILIEYMNSTFMFIFFKLRESNFEVLKPVMLVKPIKTLKYLM